MKEINLTQNKKALVDDVDYDYLNQFTWFYYINYNVKMNTGYAVRNINITHRTSIKMHQEVIDRRKIIIPYDCEIDHIDRNGVNNQRHNLRIVTHASNMFNTHIKSNNTSGHKGVSFSKERNKWEAYIKIGYEKVNLGRYKTKEEAILARLTAEERFKQYINPVI